MKCKPNKYVYYIVQWWGKVNEPKEFIKKYVNGIELFNKFRVIVNQKKGNLFSNNRMELRASKNSFQSLLFMAKVLISFHDINEFLKELFPI